MASGILRIAAAKQPDRFDRAQMDSDLTRFIGAYNDLVSTYAADKIGFRPLAVRIS